MELLTVELVPLRYCLLRFVVVAHAVDSILLLVLLQLMNCSLLPVVAHAADLMLSLRTNCFLLLFVVVQAADLMSTLLANCVSLLIQQVLSPKSFGLGLVSFGLTPISFGLRPVSLGLGPANWGLRLVPLGLNPESLGLQMASLGLWKIPSQMVFVMYSAGYGAQSGLKIPLQYCQLFLRQVVWRQVVWRQVVWIEGVSVVIFPDVWKQLQDYWLQSPVLIVQGNQQPCFQTDGQSSLNASQDVDQLLDLSCSAVFFEAKRTPKK